MYHALLTNRYLTSRVIPFIAVAAVALCVALVIIVVSVMTGFLDMVKNSGRSLMGDVVVAYPINGIPHYEELIARLKRLPEAAAATPVVEGVGILRMPYPDGPRKEAEHVQFWGIEPIGFSQVTGYENTLHWREITQDQWDYLFSDLVNESADDLLEKLSDEQKIGLLRGDDTDASDIALRAMAREWTQEKWREYIRALRFEPDLFKKILTPQQWQDLLSHDPRLVDRTRILHEGLTLQHGDPSDDRTIVLGMHVSVGNIRQTDGTYRARRGGYWWMPRFQVTLATIPITDGTIGGADTVESRVLQVVNEFVSGVFLIDDKRVMVPLKVAQQIMHMTEGTRVDPEDPFRAIGVEPARVTMVLVRAVPGVTAERLRDSVTGVYEQFAAEYHEAPLPGDGLTIQTWLQQQASFIGPVEKEREMMRTLFSLVYLVCAGLVLAIFWAIVYEKTRDIGILRSIGASRMGISWIFLRYGLLIGVAGAIAGLGLAFLVVRNINVIHEALGSPPRWLALTVLGLAAVSLVITIFRSLSGNLLPVVVGGLITALLLAIGMLALWLYQIGGVIVWDPSVYYFTKIPSEVDMNSAYITMVGAVFFSLIGAFVPAAKAADTDPVKALRYE